MTQAHLARIDGTGSSPADKDHQTLNTPSRRISNRFAQRLRKIVVFKSLESVFVLLFVVFLYSLFAIVILDKPFFDLVTAIHQTKFVKIGFTVTAIIGIFVVANELVYPRIRHLSRVFKTGIATVFIVLLILTLAYWENEGIARMIIDSSKEKSFTSIADALGLTLSILMLIAGNVFLPVVGCSFLLRIPRHSATRAR
jgi:hypothetical protein